MEFLKEQDEVALQSIADTIHSAIPRDVHHGFATAFTYMIACTSVYLLAILQLSHLCGLVLAVQLAMAFKLQESKVCAVFAEQKPPKEAHRRMFTGKTPATVKRRKQQQAF